MTSSNEIGLVQLKSATSYISIACTRWPRVAEYVGCMTGPSQQSLGETFEEPQIMGFDEFEMLKCLSNLGSRVRTCV